jgi:flagellar protein FliO/FliZ
MTLHRYRLSTFGILLVVASGFATASTEISSKGSSPFDFAATLGSLLLVIAVILGLAWVLKRMKVPSLVNQKGLRMVRQIPVGTKERIAIVEAGEEQYLVGITSQSIQLISKLEEPLEENEVSPPAFASQLSNIMKKQTHND